MVAALVVAYGAMMSVGSRVTELLREQAQMDKGLRHRKDISGPTIKHISLENV